MNKQLPNHITVSGHLLFLYGARVLQAEGYTLDYNILNNEEGILKDKTYPYYTLTFSKYSKLVSYGASGTLERCTNYAERNGDTHKIAMDGHELWAILYRPNPTIAGHKVILSDKGVKVGCTFVKWEEVDALIEARNRWNHESNQSNNQYV